MTIRVEIDIENIMYDRIALVFDGNSAPDAHYSGVFYIFLTLMVLNLCSTLSLVKMGGRIIQKSTYCFSFT